MTYTGCALPALLPANHGNSTADTRSTAGQAARVAGDAGAGPARSAIYPHSGHEQHFPAGSRRHSAGVGQLDVAGVLPPRVGDGAVALAAAIARTCLG